ncbi:class I SAM-dependent methyltransferase [Propionivibrio sp.]|uniref:class I SAM-dependent methyltransferase n=1 Tax=Propionivibrio sp. TaxID=2212460 RepID=UPI0026118BE3|nr:class I SAM-dependent methyltransferase [Propionivibrio sp.]
MRSNIRRYREQKFLVWRCGHCRSLHTGQVENLADYYQDYPMHHARLDYFSRAWYRIFLERLVRAGLRKACRILDYGCGNGHFLEFLKERGYTQIVGYDPYAMRFNDPGVLQEKYDWVIAIDVIEHVEEPRAFIGLMLNFLNPAGRLCIQTPNADGIILESAEDFIHELHVPYHRHILSRQGLVDLGRKEGLEPVAFYARYFVDSWQPGTSWSFIEAFVRFRGNDFDALFEPPPASLFLKHPSLILEFFFGYFLAPKKESQMMMILAPLPIRGA